MKQIIHKKIIFNNQVLPAEDISLSAISAAALYGKGIFTTLAIYNAKPFLWERHWERLSNNAKKIGVDLIEFSSDGIENALLQIITENKITNARARITLFDESPSRVWDFETDKKTSFLIMTGDFRQISRDVKIIISPFLINSTSPLAGVKSCNYLENLLALEDARVKGFDEAVRINERGEIVSACMANIFWIKDEKIFTPHLETGCLNGTTRSFIAEHFPVTETKVNLAELNEADDVFLTSSGIGVLRITEIEMKRFIESSKTFKKVEDLFFNVTKKT